MSRWKSGQDWTLKDSNGTVLNIILSLKML
jgi:hypothetical protein